MVQNVKKKYMDKTRGFRIDSKYSKPKGANILQNWFSQLAFSFSGSRTSSVVFCYFLIYFCGVFIIWRMWRWCKNLCDLIFTSWEDIIYWTQVVFLDYCIVRLLGLILYLSYEIHLWRNYFEIRNDENKNLLCPVQQQHNFKSYSIQKRLILWWK